jgi:mRNA interferase MazF
VKRGEIRWYTFRYPNKRRPVLILTRDEVIDRLNEIIVAPVTRTIRSLRTEVVLTSDDGMPVTCALNFDHISLAQRDRIGNPICQLPDSRWAEVQRALMIACGFATGESEFDG